MLNYGSYYFKLHALRRLRKSRTTQKSGILCNAFVNSQFDYASLIWMFCSRESYNKLKNIHYKTLKIVHQTEGTYEDLLNLSNEDSIHQKHLKFLATELFKTFKTLI